jgi:putative membrane-bound dehydrogenase-like protein
MRITFAGSRIGRFGLISLIGVVAMAGAASDDPAAQLASFQVADGFEVNLFASEVEGIANPIQCRFDEAGRLYVACSWVYPQLKPGEVADDKIIVLEDTDGDGRADRSTVFADGLMIPTGIEIGDGGVYVGNGTELLHLRDTDGDGRADERRVVLRGFGTGDAHQNINSIRWGPGAELMFSQG